jgi:transcriptional regulator with XRE-family HTH domain
VKRKEFASIDAYLESSGRTRTDLAEELGITTAALSMIANGHRMPRPALALKIHSVTGVSLKALMEGRVSA